MIELTRIRIQYLNGENIIKQTKLPINKTFLTMEALEEFRKLRELRLQYRSDQRKEGIKISVLFDLKQPI